MSAFSEVIFQTVKNKGIIILNKPHVMNALNINMATSIISALRKWENEKCMVLIKSAGDKVFCAGGDIKNVVSSRKKGDKTISIKMQQLQMIICSIIKSYKIPLLAFIDGIVMGAGAALSIHGRYRIATEKTVFAMPEATIGFIPDVGSSFFLSRLNGNLGLFLALTSHRLKGSDVYKAGIANNYCPSAELPKLEDALLHCENAFEIDAILNRFSQHVPDFSLDSVRLNISSCFSADSIEEIINRLKHDGSKWAENTLKQLMKVSPTSLKLILKEITLGKKLELKECLVMEYRLALNCLERKDFYEGIDI